MNHRVRLLCRGMGLIAVVSLAACCSESEKQRISDRIDRAIDSSDSDMFISRWVYWSTP
jgi:hypothetical protein